MSLETNSKENNPREMFRAINLLTDEKELLSLWKKYFDGLLNVHESFEEIGDEILTAELYMDELTYQEVDGAIKKVKTNKAAGIDSIPTELLKYRSYFQNYTNWYVRSG